MAGSIVFPVICAVLMSCAQLSLTQPPPQFFLSGPRPSPRSWGVPNEIFGSTGGGPAFRPPPGVLISGHGPPVSRPFGPVRHGGRPPFQLVTSTPIPTPSAWPSMGPQIQRAQETSHFEYEVMPRFPKPPTHFRAGPPRGLPRGPIPTLMTTTLPPPGMVRVLPRDAIVTSSPRPQSRTDRPPPPFVMNGHLPIGPPPPFAVTNQPPTGPPTYATPSDADFQEGFRVLNDLFREDAGADIRSNLVGGSDVSFSGGYYPSLNEGASGNGSIDSKSVESPVPTVQITPAKEQGILIAGSSPPQDERSSEEDVKPSPAAADQVKQATDISYGPPQYQQGPPHHSSFMFSDPDEPSGTYNLYSNNYDAGPPPPFHTVGNSIISPPINPQRQPPQDVRSRVPSLPPLNSPPQQKSPQNGGGYNGPPPQVIGNSLRSGGAPIPMPMMMMPLAPQQSGNEPLPSSEEVQRALGILARYASKQAQSMGMSASPQMMMQMMQQGPPNAAYGPPGERKTEQPSTPSSTYGSPAQQRQTEASSTPSSTYGTPPQQQQTQSTSNPDFLSLQVTAPPPPSSFSNAVDSYGSYTTEPADAITISASPQESSPFPSYGPPQVIQIGGYEGNGRGGEDSSGGYSSGGGSSGGYSSSGGSSGSSSGSYSSGGGWGSSGGSGGGAADLIGAKVNALRTLGTAVTGGIQQVGALKAGILNAGLNVLGGLGHAKGNIANSLKIPIMSQQSKPEYGPPKPAYGPPSTTTTSSTTPAAQYGPPQGGYGGGGGGWGQSDGGNSGPGPIAAIVNAARGVVGGITGTLAATAKAGVGIGVSKNDFVKNHFVIKGQAFTDTVSKKIQNKNEYFQNVLKHVTSIFEAAKKTPSGGWSRR